MRWALVIVIGAALGAPARAEEADSAAARTESARHHYMAGKSAYEQARYDQALHEFAEGYRLSPRPEFLLNIAQSYNKLGRRDEAMAHYESFLAADPESPFAETARSNLAALKRERPAPPSAPAPAPRLIVTAPPPRPRSKLWHLAWALPTAAVVAGAVAIGIYFGTRPAPCDPGNCIDVSHGR